VTAIIVAITGGLAFLTRIVGVRRMMLAIMFVRPSCDRVFDWLKDAFGDQSGPGASISAIVIAMAAVAILQVPAIAFSAPLLGWAGFLAAAAGSLLRTPDTHVGLRLVLVLVSYAAAFTLPYAVIKRRETTVQCLSVALGSSLVPSTVALLEVAMNPAILTGELRLQSTFTHPNIYAFYLVSVASLILYMNCSTTIALSAFMRRATLTYAGYLLFLLLLTKTRSAWASMLIILAGYSVVVDRRWLLPVLGLPTIAVFIPGISERLSDLESGTIAVGFEQLNSLAWRELLWNDTLEWLRNDPPGLLGYGVGSFGSYAPLFFARFDPQAGIGLHNAFLQTYFEMGIAGVIAFLFLMTTIMLRLIAMLNNDFAGSFTMLMVCAGYMIVFYSDNLLDYLQFQWFFWFMLGSICASGRFAVVSYSPPIPGIPVISSASGVISSSSVPQPRG
jgi:putative inorganic carbon (HCO3(-)) transporter